mgnify:CR=1 FL=1
MQNQIHEAMERYGASNLSNKQLLTVLLNGNKKLPALFEEDYLSGNTDELDILEIASLTFDELKSRGNLTDGEAARIIAGIEIGIRVATANERKQRIKINNPEDAANIFKKRMQFLNHEELVVMLLNAKHEIIGSRLISRGALTSATVDPREIYSYAISKHACFVLVAHNHCSGCPKASPEDELFTSILEAAGKILGIYLLDSIIIGRGEYYSFQEAGKLDSNND